MASAARNGGRVFFWFSAGFLLAYALNVLAGLAATRLGWALPRIGDVGEFLLVLTGMLCFVTGLFCLEDRASEAP